jgi:hypothetical protein
VRYLTELVQRYNARADRIVKRHTDDKGAFDSDYQPHVDHYRDAAGRVALLNEGLEEAPSVTAVWHLDPEAAALPPESKVTTRDKAATPQELIKKANS